MVFSKVSIHIIRNTECFFGASGPVEIAALSMKG